MNIALIVDGILGIILIFFLYRGLMNGFSGEVIGLVGFFVSTFCAWKFSEPAAEIAISITPTLTAIYCLLSAVLESFSRFRLYLP